MSSDTVIRVQQLGKCYNIYEKPQDRLKQALWRGRKQFYRQFWAVRDVSFEVKKGDTVGIIGRNGSGKSTLLQMIAGTLSPSWGTAEVAGRVAALLELGSGFNPEFTGRENVYLNGAILGLSREDIDARFDAIAAFADIGNFIDQPVKIYSSGMIVRLAFAVSINVEPDILIVDEALAVGDMGFQLKCMERLDRLTKSGITMLFVSHDTSAVKAFCTRALYMDEGRVKAAGSASDMIELYFLDIRDAQRRELGSGSTIKLRQSVGRSDAIAFGTDHGRIVSAQFEASGLHQWACTTGDVVSVIIDVEHDDTVANPSVSLVLHDHHMIDIAGRHFSLGRRRLDSSLFRSRAKFVFRASLNTGGYYLTVRLEDRASDVSFFPIDKQAGALELHVTRPASQHFTGLFDMPMECEELPAAEPDR